MFAYKIKNIYFEGEIKFIQTEQISSQVEKSQVIFVFLIWDKCGFY